LKAEDDTVVLNLNGQSILVEQSLLSGTIYWTDSDGNTHPVRGAYVNIVDNSSFQTIKTVITNSEGEYPAVTLPGNQEIFLEIQAKGEFHEVKFPGFTLPYIFSSQPLFIEPPDVAFLDITIPHNTPSSDLDVGRAFSVNDAIFVAEEYVKAVRGKPLSFLRVNFPATGTSYTPDGTNDLINIGSEDYKDWDIILHEYGHFLARSDNLGFLDKGYYHNFGVVTLQVESIR
jgi:hypothetical protein